MFDPTTIAPNLFNSAKALTFSYVDYIIFSIMLLISISLGIFFGCGSKAESSTEEYLMGNRKMKVIPVAISMMASVVSSLAIIAFPAEIYAFGINFIFGLLIFFVTGIFIYYCVLPVFYVNNISTCYEYLELRYDRATRKLVTVAFVGSYLMFLPIFLFLPSYAFSQVTNVNAHLINAVIHLICAFYTMIGGIKAVVWTDVVQGIVMVGSIVFIGMLGITKNGGFIETWRIAKEGHRLDVDFTLDLETRTTIWNSAFNYLILVTSYVGFNQSAVQRMISLPTLEKAKHTMVLFTIIYLIVGCLNCSLGLIMYAYYHNCDPILTGQVQKYDKLIPFFVQDIAGHILGVPGLFISGLFSASLSTSSAAMNSLAGVVYFDYIKPFIKHSDKKANFIMKFVVLIFAILSVLGGFFIEKFPSFVQLYSLFNSFFFGAVFSCFVLGMLMPKIHGKAIFWGMIISMLITFAFIIYAYGKVEYKPLGDTTTESCNIDFSTLVSISRNFTDISSPKGFNPSKMSFNWYIVMGALIVFIVSIPLTYILPVQSKATYNRKLLAPMVHRFVKYQLAPQQVAG